MAFRLVAGVVLLSACGLTVDDGSAAYCRRIQVGTQTWTIPYSLTPDSISCQGRTPLKGSVTGALALDDIYCSSLKTDKSSCGADCSQPAYQNLTWERVGEGTDSDWCCIVVQGGTVVARFEGFD